MHTGHVLLTASLLVTTSCGSKIPAAGLKPATTTTTVTTAAPTTTTTEAPRAVLAGDGLGVAFLGSPMDQAISRITQALGPPDYSGEWVPGYCRTGEGEGGRILVWGDLAVLFNDGGIRSGDRLAHVGEPVLWGYQYGGFLYDDAVAKEVVVARRLQPGLRTAAAIGLESTGQSIEQAYGTQAEARPGDPSEFPGPVYSVRTPNGDLYMSMDVNGPQGHVQMIRAGNGCGE